MRITMTRRTIASLAAAGAIGAILSACQPKQPAADTRDRATVSSRGKQQLAESRAAFLAAYPVLMHARCMNCHPAGNAPLQGDDSHPHLMNVQRGADGKGKFALKCANC